MKKERPSPLSYLLLRAFFVVVVSLVFNALVSAQAQELNDEELLRKLELEALEPFRKQGLAFHDSFQAKIIEDINWKKDKLLEQNRILTEMLLREKKWTSREVERTLPLADEVYAKAMDYQERVKFLCFQGRYYCEEATDMMWTMAEGALDMRMEVAEGLFKANNIRRAKEVYRDIIVTFTQPRFSSFIKKAEFALEDIKEIEAKAEMAAKPKNKPKK